MKQISHKRFFAISLWSIGTIMIVTTFIWALCHPVGDKEMIEKLIWSAFGGGAFLSGVSIYDKYRSFRRDAKNDME